MEVAVEPERAGTGGALWHARHRLDDAFLLLNGDSWFDINLCDLAARLAQEPAALGVLALRLLPDATRYGGGPPATARTPPFSLPPPAGGSRAALGRARPASPPPPPSLLPPP